jgi:uncharacterized membrane protein
MCHFSAGMHSPTGGASLSVFSIITSFFGGIAGWFRAGDPPPKTHRKSMAIMTALLIFGFAFVTMWVLALLEIGIWAQIRSPGSMAGCAFLTLCPGLYAAWVTVCCWRRIPGYSWGMIPFFD